VPQNFCTLLLTTLVFVHFGKSVELKVIISQVWQERWWVKLYTQIISKKQNSNFPQSVFKIYNQLLFLITFII